MADAREASPHQNDGSRMGLAVFETNLHEIGFKRGERALEPATERGHGLAPRGDHRRPAGTPPRPPPRPRRARACWRAVEYFPEIPKAGGAENPPPPSLRGPMVSPPP